MTDQIARHRWLVVPYGNAVLDGKPESEWSWMVNREDDEESVEVESKERAEEIAALLNAGGLEHLRALEQELAAARAQPDVPRVSGRRSA